MPRETFRLAKTTTGDAEGLRLCWGARPGDMVEQAMAWKSGEHVDGDDVTGLFHPMIPGPDMIVQARPASGIECLIVLRRILPDGG